MLTWNLEWWFSMMWNKVDFYWVRKSKVPEVKYKRGQKVSWFSVSRRPIFLRYLGSREAPKDLWVIIWKYFTYKTRIAPKTYFSWLITNSLGLSGCLEISNLAVWLLWRPKTVLCDVLNIYFYKASGQKQLFRNNHNISGYVSSGRYI